MNPKRNNIPQPIGIRAIVGLVGLVVLIIIVLGVVSCLGKGSPKPAPLAPQDVLLTSRMVDLGHTITQDMPILPGSPAPRLQKSAHTSTTALLHIGMQTGTNMQLLSHTQLTVDQLSPRDLVLPAVVLDIRDLEDDTLDPQDTVISPSLPIPHLSVNAIIAWEAQHGHIPPGCIVLLATGWDIQWGSPGDYLNLDDQQQPHVPSFATDTLTFLLQERQVGGLGIDSPLLSTPPLHLLPSPAHDPLLLLVNLTRLEQLPPTGTTLVIGALRVQHSSAAPARVIAIVPTEP